MGVKFFMSKPDWFGHHLALLFWPAQCGEDIMFCVFGLVVKWDIMIAQFGGYMHHYC